MTKQSKLEWTEYKSRFRAVTAYGTYWVELFESGTGYQLICGTNPCCEVFSSPQNAKDCAQIIHDRPASRDDWFNLSDVEQAPYHAPLDLTELLRTYETLLAGDNLPERIAVQTVDLRVILGAVLPVNAVSVQEAINSVNIHEEANSYEWRGDGDYTPSDQEKSLLEDFGHSLVAAIEDAVRAICPTMASLPTRSINDKLFYKHDGKTYFRPDSHQSINCTICNGTNEVQHPDSVFLSPCPECAQSSRVPLNLSKDKSND